MSWRAVSCVWLLITFAIVDICRAAKMEHSRRDNNTDTITIVVPAFFSDPPQLGLSITTILQLQIWRTLRKEPERNPDRLSFGNGQALWDSATLEEPTNEAAVIEAADSAQMVVWGKAYALGSGSSVMTYLTVPTIKDSRLVKFEQWKLTFKVSNEKFDVIADLPTRQYAFEPIFLPESLVSAYSSLDALTIYKTRTGRKKLGVVASASELFALRWEENSVRVRTNRVTGWLRIPQLSNTTEVVDFVGGLMRIFRADWEGALELLSRVTTNPQTPTALRIDANLLAARATYQLGGNFEPYLLEAEKYDRFSQRIIRYRVMGMLAELNNSDAGPLVERAAAAREYLDARAHLFPADDEWLVACRQLLDALTKR